MWALATLAVTIVVTFVEVAVVRLVALLLAVDFFSITVQEAQRAVHESVECGLALVPGVHKLVSVLRGVRVVGVELTITVL
jgi:hypothetical protein